MPSIPAAPVPIPPRYRWLKRTALFLSILLPVLAGVRVWWGRVADARLERAMRGIQIAGTPVNRVDFNRSAVPDELNAALVYQVAARNLKLTRAQTALVDASRRAKLNDADRRAMIESTEVSRGLMHKARTLPQCDFWFGARNLDAPRVPDLEQYARLGSAAILSAECLHNLGRDSDAVETLRDVSALTRRLAEDDTLLAVLIALGHSQMMANTVESIGPDLVQSGRVPAEELNAFNEDLLDDDFLRQGLARAVAFEGFFCFRAFQTESTRFAKDLRGVFEDPWPMEALYWLLKPAWQLDCARALREWSPQVVAAEQVHLPEVQRILAGAPRPPAALSLARPLSPMIVPTLTGTVTGTFRYRAHRALAATALALWRYRADQGRWPEHLEELVPRYLSRIPADPLSGPGTHVRYQPDPDQPQLSCGGLPTSSPLVTLPLAASRPAVTTRSGSDTP